MIKIIKNPPQPSRDRKEGGAEDAVRPIIDAVRRERDAALRRYARQLDGLADLPLRLTEKELNEAASAMPPRRNFLKNALKNFRPAVSSAGLSGRSKPLAVTFPQAAIRCLPHC